MIKKFLCWIGWHSLDYEKIKFDGVNMHVRCKWCGYKGMLDSQGNLF